MLAYLGEYLFCDHLKTLKTSTQARDPRRVQVCRLVPVARLDSAWYRVVGSDSVASSSKLLLGPLFETKAATSKSGDGVGRG